ncbi:MULTISPECIES: hypothetical protein [Bacillus subtilis group]|uniref:hypothetical protein n=1 Tax=Bacillus subtilis group TaxID=653685 RepID=UPI000470F685|nr:MULTISPECIES: hypothetical protein [Bacillus subtilis group]HWO97799.1 hypothetical protein [Bacillus sp. (in: firmicutes)]ARC76556.1 hypothetical protein B37_04589 [Bacillus licheniformis]ARW52650.1 hypothetical protein S100027_00633 [Bacillus licheniformis]AXF87345.1 hypothetical protein BLDA23_03170 [Bacillus licheniformis]MEC1810992.1 hypothetical protein [Bacillus licheniformis]
MKKIDQLLEKQDKLLEEVKFYLDAVQNESPIRTIVTDETTPGDFLKGEKLEDVGFVSCIDEEGNVVFEQYWSNNKILQFTLKGDLVIDLQLLVYNEEENSPRRKLSQAIGLLEEALRVQTDIDELESRRGEK